MKEYIFGERNGVYIIDLQKTADKIEEAYAALVDIVRNNKKITQIFLAVITLPFAFWGVESYVRNAGSNNDVATVGTAKISQQEL